MPYHAVTAYSAPEDAEQNAALMAIVYIEGALAEGCALCTLSRVGQAALPGWTPVQVKSPALPSHAQLVKVLEERMDALRTRQARPFLAQGWLFPCFQQLLPRPIQGTTEFYRP